MAILTLLVLGLQAPAAAPPERPLSVREVMENAEALDGQEIVVSGWVQRCRRLACSLYASRREARRRAPRYRLSIGSSAWFDSFAARRGPTNVTLRARFDARCVADPRSDVIVACTDRVESLQPVAIIR